MNNCGFIKNMSVLTDFQSHEESVTACTLIHDTVALKKGGNQVQRTNSALVDDCAGQDVVFFLPF